MRGSIRVCRSQLDLVKLAEGERATLQHEVDGYRAEAQEQQKARSADGPRANTVAAPAIRSEAVHRNS